MKTMLFIVAVTLSSLSVIAQNQESRKITHFNSIKVEQGIELIYTQGDEENVKAECSNTQMLRYLITEKKGNQLKIYLNNPEEKPVAEKTTIKVYITDNDIAAIEATTGASVKVNNEIIIPQLLVVLDTGATFEGKINATEQLKLKISSGAGFNGGIITGNLIVDVTKGAFVKLKGHAENSTFFCSGGTLMAEKFSTGEADIRAKHLSSVAVGVETAIRTESDQSSAIIYYGNPEKIIVSENTGKVTRGQ